MSLLAAIVFSIFFINSCCSLSYEQEIEAVKFIVEHENRPSAVVASVCWPIFWKMALIKRLWNITSQCSVRDTSHAADGQPKIGHNQINVHDLRCKGAVDILMKANTKKLHRSPLRWIIFIGANNTQFSALERLELFPDSEVLIAERMDENLFKLYYVYKTNASASLIRENYGTWQYGFKNNTRSISLDSIYTRRPNLHKTVITTSTVISESPDSAYHMTDMLFPEYDEMPKTNYIFTDMVLESLNATRVNLFTESWGYVTPNGSWTGATGHLQRRDAIIATPAFMIASRMDVEEYIITLTPTRVRFIFRRPPLSYVSNIYALPLSISVWLAIGVCVLTLSLSLYVGAMWETRRASKIEPSRLGDSYGDIFLMAVAAMFQQGCHLEPRRISGRVSLFVLFTALMALYAAYCANIVVLLRAPSDNIKTVADLLNSRMQLGASDSIYNKVYFSQQVDPVRKAIYEKKIAPPGGKENFFTRGEGLEKMRKEMFAFNIEVSPAYRYIQKKFMESEKCGLEEIDYLNVLNPYMPIELHCPYRDIMKVKFHWLQEVGLASRFNRRMLVDKPVCSQDGSSFVSVGIIDFYPALLWMLYGFSVAWFIWLMEWIFYFKSARKRRFNNKTIDYRRRSQRLSPE